MQITTVGLDIAKNVSGVHAIDVTENICRWRWRPGRRPNAGVAAEDAVAASPEEFCGPLSTVFANCCSRAIEERCDAAEDGGCCRPLPGRTMLLAIA